MELLSVNNVLSIRDYIDISSIEWSYFQKFMYQYPFNS